MAWCAVLVCYANRSGMSASFIGVETLLKAKPQVVNLTGVVQPFHRLTESSKT